MSEILVDVKNLSKEYKRGGETLVVLDDLNLEIPKEDYLALMGPSGSGKSTLLNLIGGLGWCCRWCDVFRIQMCASNELLSYGRWYFFKRCCFILCKSTNCTGLY